MVSRFSRKKASAVSTASGSERSVKRRCQCAPEIGALVPGDDGFIELGFVAGAVEEGAEETVGVEDGADDGDVGVGVAEVFDDFVVPVEEVFAVARICWRFGIARRRRG